MKKVFQILLLMVIALQVVAGDLFLDRTAHIWFFSDSPMEKIEAHNRQCSAILNSKEGTVAFKAVIKSFEFKNALMQEHFNENYMESDKYENATFDGKIDNLSEVDFTKNGTYKIKVSGKLTIHGVTKEVTENGTLTVSEGKIGLDAKFSVLVADYKIKIPQAVVNNIAKQIEITVDADLSPYTR